MSSSAAMRKLWQNQFFSSCLVPKTLHLKKGAQVMLTKNVLSKRLVNGSRGVVVDFVSAVDASNEIRRRLEEVKQQLGSV